MASEARPPAITPEILETAETANAAARKRARALGLTPIGSTEFSRLLDVSDQAVTQWRSDARHGRGGPTPALPEPTWMLSAGARPVWATKVARGYRDARKRNRTTFDLAIDLVDELEPMGKSDIADYLGVERSTISQWIRRGRLPSATWDLGREEAWARGVIDTWWNALQDTQIERNRESERLQDRIARNLVARMKEQGILELDPEAGTVTVAGATLEVDEVDMVGLEAI